MRRNLPFFLAGALIALAAVLAIRSADGGTPAPAAQPAVTQPKEAARLTRSVRIAR
ncbi:MAG: hypothetical protein JWR30_3557, partial [Conexibacter sp.]|nr:hypothetical protein [Conexibacter sp.]